MTTIRGYVLTAIIFHVSLLIGLLCYACKDVDQNGLMGLRTPRTVARSEDWNHANSMVSRVMVSGLTHCCTGIALVLIIGLQVAVLIGFAARWWSTPE